MGIITTNPPTPTVRICAVSDVCCIPYSGHTNRISAAVKKTNASRILPISPLRLSCDRPIKRAGSRQRGQIDIHLDRDAAVCVCVGPRARRDRSRSCANCCRLALKATLFVKIDHDHIMTIISGRGDEPITRNGSQRPGPVYPCCLIASWSQR
jgi:hypothetical protein